MSESGGTFINIPGNIKQKNLPFVLDPRNSINSQSIDVADKNGKSVTTVSGSPAAQVFSFKPSAWGGDYGASAEEAGFLRIAPAAFYNENGGSKVSYTQTSRDLSYKLLYRTDMRDGSKESTSANAQNILNSLPSVSVREYLQDSKLN